MPQKRKPGISVLIATQNEEAVVGLCIRSFLDFGDELIVVDNGSADHTKDIVRDLQTQYPQRIKFFDRPELPDLYHNRRFALAQSSYEWLVRADADYVAYTEGKYDIMQLREYLLSLKRTAWPEIVYVPQVNIVGDFQRPGFGAPRRAHGAVLSTFSLFWLRPPGPPRNHPLLEADETYLLERTGMDALQYQVRHESFLPFRTHQLARAGTI